MMSRLGMAKRFVADILRRPPPDGATRPPRPATGRGGATGTPSKDADEAPPSIDQEANAVVSGGGLVDDGHEPSTKARRSR